MNKAFFAIGIAMSIGLGGCAAPSHKPQSAVEGVIHIGEQNMGVMAPIQAKLEDILLLWDSGDMADATEKLETLLDRYASDDGAFERALLTTLALYYLEMGNRADFQHSVVRLRGYIHDRVYLPRESQYGLLVEQGMKNCQWKLPGRGVNPRFVNAIRDLLSSGESSIPTTNEGGPPHD